MWTRIRKRPGPRRDLAAFLDEGSTIEGKYRCTGTVMLNGRFSGEIQSSDTLIIGDKGVVKANIRAGTLIVSGELIGNAVAGERQPTAARRSTRRRPAPWSSRAPRSSSASA